MLGLASGGDVVVRALCTSRALGEGWLAVAVECSGISADAESGGRGQTAAPGPLTQAAGLEFAAWPQALQESWRALLCCQSLLASHCLMDGATYAQRVAESYGWPKSDYYWWVLSVVKGDPSLLRNLSGGPEELVAVARI